MVNKLEVYSRINIAFYVVNLKNTGQKKKKKKITRQPNWQKTVWTLAALWNSSSVSQVYSGSSSSLSSSFNSTGVHHHEGDALWHLRGFGEEARTGNVQKKRRL